MPPACYSSLEVFEVEQRSLFLETWQFAGFARALDREGASFEAPVGDRTVVVERARGELRASTASAPERWLVSALGDLVFVKFREAKRAPPDPSAEPRAGRPEPQASRGDKFARDASPSGRARAAFGSGSPPQGGELSGAAPENQCATSLERSLGRAFELVARVGDALGERFCEDVRVVAANWKLPIENALEHYHLPVVHARTLARAGFSGVDFHFDGPHSWWFSPLGDAAKERWDRLAPYFPERSFRNDGYVHLLVFPNLLIAAHQGTVFSIEQVIPLGPRETRFVNHLFLARGGSSSKPARRAVIEAFQDQVAELGRATLGEDLAICEQAQLGLDEHEGASYLCAEEARVGAFERAYLSAMPSGGVA
jgi:phenylpropionate dioxygenase-like ring-hydroxylating dioxygenase large terminal subunit